MRRPRRSLLAAIGSMALAGCLAGDDESPANDSSPDDDLTPLPDDDRTLPPSGTDPNGYPDYDVDRLVAFDEIDPGETAIYLEPSAASITESERLTFTLFNESSGGFSYNPYAWQLHKRVDGRWHYVAPRGINEPAHTLEPGDNFAWDLSVDNDGIEDGRPIGGHGVAEPDPIAGLGGGEYVFGTDVDFDDGPAEGSVGFCARFDLETDSLSLTTTDAITSVEWAGDVIVASSDRVAPEDDDTRLGAYELVRTDDDVEGTELIRETLLRNDQLRDAIVLAREYDADRVRLEEYNAVTPIFGVDDTRYYHYDGEAYAISARVIDDD
ncbi:hypothetical protein [Natrinema sp. CGMCC1.2065]|uniref:hypothetical protein n=1 Tax=Natrinema sp. CGMCC1.2065 TaxID=3445767 RepID=UPI003F49DAD4